MFIPDPDFFPPQILDLGSQFQQQQKEGEQFFSYFLSLFTKNQSILPKLFLQCSQKYGIRKKTLPEWKSPRSRIRSKNHQIPDPNP
jgi:hypothetical protein